MDFLSSYMEYTKDTESPRIYHRWCILTGASALFSRSLYLWHNNSRLYSNIYCMLIGEPAARKSTAVKLSRKLLLECGYDKFAADKSSKEQFLVDLATDSSEDIELPADVARLRTKKGYDNTTYNNLWGATSNGGGRDPKEVFIAADEFNDFAGTNNQEFYTTLGNLWDWDSEQPYSQRLRSGSIAIYQPTVSLLGGNTQENFSRAFPPETLGTGFLSRMLLIYGTRTARKIAFPRRPSEEETKNIVNFLHRLRTFFAVPTEVTLTGEAHALLETIYDKWEGLEDVRFARYNQRRFTHLLKLCVLLVGLRLQTVLTAEIVIEANTYLTAAEMQMSEALGEFGRAKTSPVANNILQMLEAANAPVTVEEIWKQFRKELDKMSLLVDIIQSLRQAQRIQYVTGRGWLPFKSVRKTADFINWDLLTQEERDNVT